MPTIKIIDSIKIDVYAREHPPPHFHVLCAEYEELIVIETLETYIGYIPVAQRKKVIKWAKTQKELLLENFKRLNPRL
ncbi:MAG: DUF4160 domain-containing protein [Bacteroidetes bacterium]|nr:DUF4160 domain-containing protein [Bacteroidota bacterium]MBL7105602.1 DUF4160 domain-containing protein [Bacteroidales bacterium]